MNRFRTVAPDLKTIPETVYCNFAESTIWRRGRDFRSPDIRRMSVVCPGCTRSATGTPRSLLCLCRLRRPKPVHSHPFESHSTSHMGHDETTRDLLISHSEREGFEPSRTLLPCGFSRAVVSAISRTSPCWGSIENSGSEGKLRLII